MNEHGGNIWTQDQKIRGKIIDFSASINPLGFPKGVKNVIRKNIDSIVHYPAPKSDDLKKSLANIHEIDSDNLLIGNGSIELIYLIVGALGAQRVLIPIPTFSEYEFASRGARAKCLFLKSNEKTGFKIDTEKLLRLIPQVDLVFLCNPNNPTGQLFKKMDILEILSVCHKNNTILIIDEAFIDFVSGNKGEISLISEAATLKNLLVLRSLTKKFAIPGLRLGYLVGERSLIRNISCHLYPWNVNRLAQVAGMEAIEDQAYIKKTELFINRERSFLRKGLKGIEGVKLFDSTANYFLCKLENRVAFDVNRLQEKLIDKNIIIRNCSNFRGLSNRFFRVAIRKRADNVSLIKSLAEGLR
ncbi:MAG: threonine-phosphate decarboxylase CobD [Nitrospinota bacterium]